jgi:hypothetical protein
MRYSALMGGVTGFAICTAAAALPTWHSETSATGAEAGVAATGQLNGGTQRSSQATASAIQNGSDGAQMHAGGMRMNSYYRFPGGYPYPNPTRTPGRIVPFERGNNAVSSTAKGNGGLLRR